MNNNTIQDTVDWFKQAVPNVTEKQAVIQLGCCFEEVGELLESISGEYDDDGVNLYTRSACEEIGDLSKLLKECADDNFQPSKLPQDPILDALTDIIVTAVGVSHMLGHDVVGALNEVNRANFSKFEDGKPVFDANGKIAKGKNYTKPNLKPFLNVNKEGAL